MRYRLNLWTTLVLALQLPAISVDGQVLSLSCRLAAPGEMVQIAVDVGDTVTTVALQLEIGFDATRLEVESAAAGSATFDLVVVSHAPSPGRLRVVAYSPSNTPLAPGTVLTFAIRVLDQAATGGAPFSLADVVLADATGESIGPVVLEPAAVQIFGGPFADSFECGDLSLWSEVVAAAE